MTTSSNLNLLLPFSSSTNELNAAGHGSQVMKLVKIVKDKSLNLGIYQ